MTESVPPSAHVVPGARPSVVVFDPVPGISTWGPEEAIFGARGVDLIVPADAAEADESIRTADAVIVTGYGRLDAGRVATLERCAGILCYSIGMDKVDAPSAAAAGIPVRNVPDYCTDEVSDHALALLLAAERRIVSFATATAAGGWPNDRSMTGSLRRLRGQTLGLAGAGRIGRLVAAKARAFGFRTVAYDPYLTAALDADLPLVGRDELFSTTDAIVICAAYTPGDPPLVTREALAMARPGLILVNISRGGHVDEQALAEALADGRVAVAALDVRAQEPPDPAADPLSGLGNVILTPHVAGSSREAVEDLHRLAAESVLDLLERGGRISAAA